MNTYLLKTEPSTYSLDDLERDGQTEWDGVRNHQAKLVLAGMKVGDEAYIYHSVDEKRVVGLAKVVGEPHPDAKDTAWVAVPVAFVRRFKRPITLADFKAAAPEHFPDFLLIRHTRLSCVPVPPAVAAWVKAQEEA